MREIVENQRNGFLFTSISRLLQLTGRLMEDDCLRRTLSENAALDSRRFGKDVFAARARALGEELLAPSGT